MQVVYADSGFSGEGFGRQIEQQCGVKLHIVERITGKGFEVWPNRWLIEQVFGCQGRYRRIEGLPDGSPINSRGDWS